MHVTNCQSLTVFHTTFVLPKNSVVPNLELTKLTWKSYWRFKLIVNKLPNSLVIVLDINDANDVIKPTTLLSTLHDVLWCHKDVFTVRNISNAYKEETLVSNYVLCHF